MEALGVTPPLTPPHRGEGNRHYLRLARVAHRWIIWRDAKLPSPLWGGIEGGGMTRQCGCRLRVNQARRILTGAVPKAREKLRENAAADENPVRSATSAMLTRVSTTRRRAAFSLSLR